MSSILKLYTILLPLVLGSALIEGLWISRTRGTGYNWREWATSLGDVAVRRLLAFAGSASSPEPPSSSRR
ncbi:MAG TPA: hypothetical protein VKY24_04525 [Reyranella sp.]|nr:hypothetical protein [Reyranella sp.]